MPATKTRRGLTRLAAIRARDVTSAQSKTINAIYYVDPPLARATFFNSSDVHTKRSWIPSSLIATNTRNERGSPLSLSRNRACAPIISRETMIMSSKRMRKDLFEIVSIEH